MNKIIKNYNYIESECKRLNIDYTALANRIEKILNSETIFEQRRKLKDAIEFCFALESSIHEIYMENIAEHIHILDLTHILVGISKLKNSMYRIIKDIDLGRC